MKKINLIWLIIGMIGLIAGASLIAFNLTDASFTPTPIQEDIRHEGIVTFDCGKTPMDVMVYGGGEPNIDDDFEDAVKKVCTQEVTNAVDWNLRIYKQNEFGLRSFDEDVLKKDVCIKSDLNFNVTSKECYEETEPEPEPEEPEI